MVGIERERRLEVILPFLRYSHLPCSLLLNPPVSPIPFCDLPSISFFCSSLLFPPSTSFLFCSPSFSSFLPPFSIRLPFSFLLPSLLFSSLNYNIKSQKRSLLIGTLTICIFPTVTLTPQLFLGCNRAAMKEKQDKEEETETSSFLTHVVLTSTFPQNTSDQTKVRTWVICSRSCGYGMRHAPSALLVPMREDGISRTFFSV